MSEQEKPFVINDRRKFRGDGEPRETPVERTEPVVAQEEPTISSGPTLVNSAHIVTPVPEPAPEAAEPVAEQSFAAENNPELPPPPTAEEVAQVRAAYEQTTDRLDTMIRSQNLGGEHLPPMDFTQLVQSLYMSAMIQLGAGTQQGQQARVDLIGARQTIDMLGVVEAKAGSNLSEQEARLLDAALFELRMGFLEITQLLARQAAAKQQQPGGGPTGAGGFGAAPGFTGGGPRIVR